MIRWFKVLLFFIFFMPVISVASNLQPAIIVVPFLKPQLQRAQLPNANILLVIQNSTGVDQTITNMVPKIPSGSAVTADIIENTCGYLAPGQTCDATVHLGSLHNHGGGKLNISVCSYRGMLCSRITQDLSVINASLSEIFVFPTNESIANGTTQQFTAIGVYNNNSSQDITESVTWASSNTNAATISNATGSKGLATAIATGTTAISATLNGKTGSSNLTVNSATLTSINVFPVHSSIAVGTTLQFNAIGIFSDNSHQLLTNLATWGSSTPSIATISNDIGSKGLASGKISGLTTISATVGAVSNSVNLTVSTPTLEAISITPMNSPLGKGEQMQYTATGIYSDNTTQDLTDQVKWNTRSAVVAVISNHTGSKGRAYGHNAGSTTVTATMGSISGQTNITVTPAVLQSIDVSPTNSSLEPTETLQYTATGIFSDNSVEDITDTVTWLSSNNSMATITATGLATGVAAGAVTISAQQSGISGSTTLNVNAATLTSIAVTPANSTVANGSDQQFTATGTYSNLATRDITQEVTWISATPSVAVISNLDDSKGLATGTGVGSSLISANLSGVNGNTTLNVSAATILSITVTPANATMANNTSMQYTATGTYSDASTHDITKEVTWRSSSSRVSISNANSSKGLATAESNGSSTISATLNSIVGSTNVTVVNVNIGDSINGGVVACLEGGLNNLLVANVNNSAGITWGGTGTSTNAQSSVDGQANTTRIVNVLGAGTSYAAGICDAYEIDSGGNTPCVVGNTCYKDWFLPSTNQIACIRDNRNQIGGFTKTQYWSSTESAENATANAWSITFANNGHPPDTANKSSTFSVRCARLING